MLDIKDPARGNDPPLLDSKNEEAPEEPTMVSLVIVKFPRRN